MAAPTMPPPRCRVPFGLRCHVRALPRNSPAGSGNPAHGHFRRGTRMADQRHHEKLPMMIACSGSPVSWYTSP